MKERMTGITVRATAALRATCLAFAVAALSLAGAAPALAGGAAEEPAGGLEFHEPWVRATTPSGENSAGYLEIHNATGSADRLIGASADIARSVEVHEHEMDGGVMRMRHLADGLALPAGEQVVLEPRGYHLMLIGLNEQLVEGEAISIALEFEQAGEVELEFEVRPLRE